MQSFLRQSTASQSRAIGPFVDETDGKTAETALTIANTDIKLVVNGGASANKNSGGGTHRVNGVYGVTFDATDTATVGEVEVSVFVAGALPVFHTFFVLEEAIYDALFAASANAFTGAAGSTTLTALASGSITAAVIATGAIDADAIADNAIDAGAIASDAITAAKIATGAITAAKFAAGAIDAAAIANGAIDAATFAADVDAEILSYLVDDATRIDASALNTATVTTIPAILVDTGTTLDGKLDTIDGIVDSILVDTAEIGAAGAGLTALASAANLATVDTVVDAIKLKTDLIPASPASTTNITAATGVVLASATHTGAVIPTVTAVTNNVNAVLADTAHGGSSATLTFSRFVGLSASKNLPCVSLTGNGSAAALQCVGGSTGAAATLANAGGTSGLVIGGAAYGFEVVGPTSPLNPATVTQIKAAITNNTLDVSAAGVVQADVAAILGDFVPASGLSAAGQVYADNGWFRVKTPADADIAVAATALSTATWTGTLATNLATTNTTVATNLNATVGSRATQTSVDDLPTNAELATALGAVPTAAQNAAAVLAAGDVDGYSLEQTLKLCLAALAGKLSGAATTTVVIRAADDSKARLTATVDADGNRTAITYDAAG